MYNRNFEVKKESIGSADSVHPYVCNKCGWHGTSDQLKTAPGQYGICPKCNSSDVSSVKS